MAPLFFLVIRFLSYSCIEEDGVAASVTGLGFAVTVLVPPVPSSSAVQLRRVPQWRLYVT